jgi:hypothetical protein
MKSLFLKIGLMVLVSCFNFNLQSSSVDEECCLCGKICEASQSSRPSRPSSLSYFFLFGPFSVIPSKVDTKATEIKNIKTSAIDFNKAYKKSMR